jgi:hypothetical protein
MRGPRRSGMTLLEVMVALVFLATVFVLLTQVQRASVAKGANARAQSIAARLGEQFVRRVEAGMVPDLDDGYEGDFSEDGYGSFTYLVGIGDGSDFAGPDSSALDPAEEVLRRFRQQAEEDEEDTVLPEKTRLYLTISFPSFENPEELVHYSLETLVDSWAIEQDYALFEALWPGLLPAEIQ